MNLLNKHHETANKLIKLGEFSKALAAINKAAEQSPDAPDILSDRGVIYYHLEKFDLALIDLNRAQELEPNYGYRYTSRAYVKAKMGDIDSAIADYEKALELDPDDAVIHNNMGLLLEQKGYTKQAKNSFKNSDDILGIQTAYSKQIEGKDEPSLSKDTDNTKQKTFFVVLLNSIFSVSGRKEFIAFIKNGFKVK